MKKILYTLCTLLTFAACSKQEIDEPVVAAADATFTFQLALEAPLDENGVPQAPNTRATVTTARYILEMYEGSTAGTKVRQENTNGTFKVSMKKDIDYVCLFWADGGTDDYTATNLQAVQQTTPTAIGKVAYYAAKTVNSNTTDWAVKLTHAVAEMVFVDTKGFATTDNKLVVTYPFGASTFNVADGTVTRGTGTIVRTFSGIGAVAANGTVATDYLLAPAAKATISGLRFTLNTEDEKTIAQTPVQANYRTKLSGTFTN